MEATKKLLLMGGEIEVILYDVDQVFAEDMFERMYEEGLRLQKIFNFFDKESELSTLNRERSTTASPELVEVLEKALEYCKKTDGEYDISRGLQIKDRKEGKTLRKISCTYKNIKIASRNIILLHPDVLVDLGSIAKGFIVDRLVEYLQSNGIESGFIDARGDMRIFGKHLEVIETQHPRKKSEALFPIKLKDKAIATSGDYNQYYENKSKCHILGKKDLISTTVISNTLIEADVLATCLFVLGQERSNVFLSENNISALIINKKQEPYVFNQFNDFCIGGEKIWN